MNLQIASYILNGLNIHDMMTITGLSKADLHSEIKKLYLKIDPEYFTYNIQYTHLQFPTIKKHNSKYLI